MLALGCLVLHGHHGEVVGVMFVLVGIVVVGFTACFEGSKMAALLQFDCAVAVLLLFDQHLTEGGWVAFPFCFSIASLDTSLT